MEISDSSSSDDDNEDADSAVPGIQRGGTRKGKLKNIERRRVFYSHLLYNDFWGPQPVNNASYFKRFFRVSIGLFDEIITKTVAYDDYFRQKKDAAGKLGLSSHQKVASSMRLLTSGVSSADQDDKYRMAASIGLETMKRFCEAIDAVYAETALRHPTEADINRLLDEGLSAGWPGCIGSVATVVLESIAVHSCRFWHFNFGSPGRLNDINILDRSPLFHNAVKWKAPQVKIKVNNNEYKCAYWLADWIYPQYACFVKAWPHPKSRMQKLF